MLICTISRKITCYFAIIGIIGLLTYNFGFEESSFNLKYSFATTTTVNSSDPASVSASGESVADLTNSTVSDLNQTNINNASSTSLVTTIQGAEKALTGSQLSSSTTTANETDAPSMQLVPNFKESNSGSYHKESGDLKLSDPFYTSNHSIVLNKFNLTSMSDPATTKTKELQIFYELGLIDDSEIVYNIGYYVEESKSRATLNQSLVDSQITESLVNDELKFAKGTGFYVATTDADIIGWNAYDQVYNQSDNVTNYLGIIYYSTNEIPGGKFSHLSNKVGIYEYDLYSNGSAIRNLWLWPTITTTPATPATSNLINNNQTNP